MRIQALLSSPHKLHCGKSFGYSKLAGSERSAFCGTGSRSFFNSSIFPSGFVTRQTSVRFLNIRKAWLSRHSGFGAFHMSSEEAQASSLDLMYVISFTPARRPLANSNLTSCFSISLAIHTFTLSICCTRRKLNFLGRGFSSECSK